MSEQPGWVYKISSPTEVNIKVVELAKEAEEFGLRGIFLDVLKKAISELKVKPFEWGDPTNTTKRKGGMVYFGARRPVVIRYAVYEKERVVWLLKVMFLPPWVSL